MQLIIRSITIVVSTVVLILLSGIIMKSGLEKGTPNAFDTSSDGFAVVELFTSQGCSSCPAADRFLSELLKESEAANKNVYALSFHVDYWDRLGWKDPYGNKAFTDRQRAYAQAFGSSQVYTPQMVINGGEAFVGSQRNQGRDLVDQALEDTSAAKILTLSVKNKNKELFISTQSSGTENDLVVNFALVERDITTEVKRGENGGRLLHHDNVVRIFKSVEIDSDGRSETVVALPDDVDRSKAAIIAYLQEPGSMKILAAKSAAL